MKKIILSLALVGSVVFMPVIAEMKNQDSPNDKIKYRKTSIEERIDEEMEEEINEASILIEDELKPKCKCKECPKEN